MTLRHADRTEIRQYLLGEVTRESRLRRIEEMILTDEAFYEELLVSEDELIDEYVRESLSASERERFESHFLSTPERRRKLKFARALRRYVAGANESEATAEAKAGERGAGRERKSPWKRFFSLQVSFAAAALVLLGVAFFVWYAYFRQTDADRGLLALKSAYRDQRPVETRISALENYAPFVATRGGAEAKVDALSRERAERLLLDAAHDSPGPEASHALGEFYLASGQPEKAAEQLESALKAAPDDARLHSDLGAARIELAKSTLARGNADENGEALRQLALALEHLNRALALDPALPEAIFNRALSHEYMSLPSQAEEDWRAYLEKDSSSLWADEARRRLGQLEERRKKSARDKENLPEDFLAAYSAGDEEAAWRALERGSVRTGNQVVEALIDAHLEAAAKEEPDESDRQLQALAFAGELKFKKTGDRYAADLARVYSSITAERRTSLAEARRLAREGQTRITSSAYQQAFESYTAAKQLFDKAGDVSESRQAEYWLAICLLYLKDEEKSASILRHLTQTCETDCYKWLAARSLNGLASYEFRFNEYSMSIAFSKRALASAEQSHDAYGWQSAISSLIEIYRTLGDYEQALIHLQRAQNTFSAGPVEPKQLWLINYIAAHAYNSLGLYAAAADYEKAALQQALELKDISQVCPAYVDLAIIYGKMRDFNEALANGRRAFEVAASRSDEPAGQRMMAYTSLQLGDLYRRIGDTGEALASYRRSVELYGVLNAPTFLYQAHKGMLLTHIADGNIVAAQEELSAAAELYEQNRGKILEQANKSSFSDAEQDVFDVATDFNYSILKDSESAFDYSERSRARSLLDSTENGARVARLAEIRDRMRDGAQVVEYAALENRLLIWVVSKSDFRTVEVGVTLQELSDSVRDYVQAVKNPRGDDDLATQRAKKLYALLVQPVEPFLDRNRPLFVVPDKILATMSFGALVSPASGKYLLEDFQITLAPSANMLLACADEARMKAASGEERLLSVGNPRFDREEFKDLPDLPAAKLEAERIAALYTSPVILSGASATREAVAREMTKAGVIHLALHSVVNEQMPLRSRLLLAKAGRAVDNQTDDGSLPASQIYAMQLPRARLVVLSACETATGRVYRGEGVLSIARTFVARGVPLVVASLWAVDSDATAQLMFDFHRYRRRAGLPTAEALRRAQLDMLSGPDRRHRAPFYWASFNLIGGHADF